MAYELRSLVRRLPRPDHEGRRERQRDRRPQLVRVRQADLDRVNPNNEAGTSFSVRNGCGCGIARRRNPDTFNYWELTLDTAAMEPEMQAFMLGAATIENGADVVGVAFPSALACDEQSPAVAFEFWAENVVGSGLTPPTRTSTG